MRSAQHLAVRAALFGAMFLAAGCFRPKIISGVFVCGDSGACPDNFHCDKPSGFCISNGTDAGPPTGTGGKGGAGGMGGVGGRDAGVDRPCLDPVSSATCPTDASVSGLCDPVCNTGCQCFEKCSVNIAGALTCNPPASGGRLVVFDKCNQSGSGPSQTDDCAPGELCVANAECGSRCYQLCSSDNDCSNGASCSRDAGGGNKFCDSPPVSCDPVRGAAGTATFSGCASSPNTLGCYLASTGLDRTICDCPFSGGSYLSTCVHSRDCFPGLVCYDPTGGVAPSPLCYPVCRLSVDGGVAQPGEQGCTGGLPCQPFDPPNPTYGYCPQG